MSTAAKFYCEASERYVVFHLKIGTRINHIIYNLWDEGSGCVHINDAE